jgi:hypothetical protein
MFFFYRYEKLKQSKKKTSEIITEILPKDISCIIVNYIVQERDSETFTKALTSGCESFRNLPQKCHDEARIFSAKCILEYCFYMGEIYENNIVLKSYIVDITYLFQKINNFPYKKCEKLLHHIKENNFTCTKCKNFKKTNKT